MKQRRSPSHELPSNLCGSNEVFSPDNNIPREEHLEIVTMSLLCNELLCDTLIVPMKECSEQFHTNALNI